MALRMTWTGSSRWCLNRIASDYRVGAAADLTTNLAKPTICDWSSASSLQMVDLESWSHSDDDVR
jgi:hypothetical protein